MNIQDIKIGNIVKSNIEKRYRIVAVLNKTCTLCEMDTTKFVLISVSIVDLIDLINDDEYMITNDEDEKIIFDYNSLSLKEQQNFDKKKKMMVDVINEYKPDYMMLMKRKGKIELKNILEKYEVPTSSFWRICRSYFQSGFKDLSLVDKKSLGIIKRKRYEYKKKPGAKSDYFIESGVIKNDEIEEYFKEALKDFKSGRHKTMRSAFDKMNLLHFSKVEMINGSQTLTLLPESERPTLRQFRYYVNTHTTKEEIDKIKTSAKEQRNNKRLITSDALIDVYGPGDIVEIDAVEADVSLVSEIDPNQSIGRPINYFMIDVFTKNIVAVSVSFDNNSVLGLTNLFLNLGDDKQKYCKRYGIELENPMLWPSNFIPRRLRVDRGSDFKSKEFDRICNVLGIEKQIVPGGSGSLKGVVEQSFHQMHSQQNVHLENYGLIEKRFDSNHHKEATLNIFEYTKMVINFVLFHNQQYNKKYPLTKEMIKKEIQPIPVALWDYGVSKYGNPRPIPVKEQYLYDLMTPVKASLSKRGISYKGLWYLPDNDPELTKEMFDVGTKKKSMEVRIDKRDVAAIYYLRNNKLICAPLNPQITGNLDYIGMTFKEYDDFRKKKKQMDALGRVHNEKLSSFLFAVNESIVDNSKKDTFANSKDISKHREIDKQKKSKENNIRQRLIEEQVINENDISVIEEKKHEEVPKVSENKGEFSSWEEALASFDDDF